MKKIFIIALIAVIGFIGYKATSKKVVGTGMLKKIEKQIEANKKAAAGDTIVCPICHTEFERKPLSPYDFDTDECREKYKKIVNTINKVNEFGDKAANVAKDTKKSIEKNF